MASRCSGATGTARGFTRTSDCSPPARASTVRSTPGDLRHIPVSPAGPMLNYCDGMGLTGFWGTAMHAQEHSTFREGLMTGAIGALIVAVWYFIVDTAGGQPFHTPNTLGKIFFRGDLAPGVRRIIPEVVLGYTVFHFLVYALIGMGLTLLVHLATRNLALRMGVWIGLVVAF